MSGAYGRGTNVARAMPNKTRVDYARWPAGMTDMQAGHDAARAYHYVTHQIVTTVDSE